MTERIKIYTRSMNPMLYRQAMALHDLPYECVRLEGTTAEGYIAQAIADEGADWVVNIDEDAFVCNPAALQRLLSYCIAEGYTACGMPDGGVVSLRDGNPAVTNPFFNVWHTAALRQHGLRQPANFCEASFPQPGLLRLAYSFEAADVEPYYPLLLSVASAGRTLYLDARTHADGLTTVLLNHEGEPFVLHTWYSRCYGRDIEHTRRINAAFGEACRAQGLRYSTPLADHLKVATSLAMQRAVDIKHKIERR